MLYECSGIRRVACTVNAHFLRLCCGQSHHLPTQAAESLQSHYHPCTTFTNTTTQRRHIQDRREIYLIVTPTNELHLQPWRPSSRPMIATWTLRMSKFAPTLRLPVCSALIPSQLQSLLASISSTVRAATANACKQLMSHSSHISRYSLAKANSF